MLAPFFWLESPPSNVLIAGIGGGNLIRFFRNSLPKVKLTTVERDELAMKLAQKYFYVDRQDAHFIIGDAFCTLENLSQQNDIIVIDLHLKKGMSDFLVEESFYHHCYQNLSEEGIACLNILPVDKHHLVTIMKVIRTVFNQRCLYAAIPNHDNIAIYAFKRFPKINRSFAEIIDLSKSLSDDYKVDFLSIWREIESLNPILQKNELSMDKPRMSNILPK